MTEPYTPTTDEVREAVAEWMWSRRMFRDQVATSDDRELDRWLTAHDAEVVAAERARIARDALDVTVAVKQRTGEWVVEAEWLRDALNRVSAEEAKK